VSAFSLFLRSKASDAIALAIRISLRERCESRIISAFRGLRPCGRLLQFAPVK
jgi:hypothetical protein